MQAHHGAAGVDHVAVDDCAGHLDENLEQLAAALRRGDYQPQAIRRVYLPQPDGGERPLGIPTVRDRVVQTALRQVVEPIIERDFAAHSYGLRPGRGCKDALRRVEGLLPDGHYFVVEADLHSYFDTIPHERLLDRIRAKVADGRVLALLAAFLQQGVFDGLEDWLPEDGTPQGAALTPLLANIYLDPLDHWVVDQGLALVRYADDFVICVGRPRQRNEPWTWCSNGRQLTA